MKVVGFDHVVVNTSNTEALLAFYCGELGLAGERVDEWRRGEVLFPSVRVSAETLIDLLKKFGYKAAAASGQSKKVGK